MDTLGNLTSSRRFIIPSLNNWRYYKYGDQDKSAEAGQSERFVQNDLKVSRVTASGYLNRLANDGFLTKKKLGVGNYYINTSLVALFTR